MAFIRVMLGRPAKWPVVVPMYRLRECPACAALVLGDEGQKTHQEWHDWADPADDDDEIPALDGYVIGTGPLPAEMRGED